MWTNPINYYGNVVKSVPEEKPASGYMERIAGIEHVTFADITIGSIVAIEAPLYDRIYDVTGQQAWDYLCRYTQDKIKYSLGGLKVKAEIKEKNGLYFIGLITRNVPNPKVDFLQIRVSEQPTFRKRVKMDLEALANVLLQR